MERRLHLPQPPFLPCWRLQQERARTDGVREWWVWKGRKEDKVHHQHTPLPPPQCAQVTMVCGVWLFGVGGMGWVPPASTEDTTLNCTSDRTPP